MEEKPTSELMNVLNQTTKENTADFLRQNEAFLLDSEKPFTDYFRKTIAAKGIPQQRVFLDAELPERYGYKLISGEKKTKQRDYILRLCFAGHFTRKETERALKLYGLSPLYPPIKRDTLLIIALNNSIYQMEEVNEYLRQNGEAELTKCKSAE